MPLRVRTGPLGERLLLTKTMKTSQSPDDLRRIDPYYTTAGKTTFDDPQRFLIPVTPKGGDDHRLIGDIKISIGSRQALVFIYDGFRHRQLDDVEGFPVQQ